MTSNRSASSSNPHLALYIGGMGAKGKNFYHSLATSYGYGPQADRIQELYLAGEKEAAAKAVPDELVRDVSLIGSAGFVKERVAAFREAGVTALNVVPIAETPRRPGQADRDAARTGLTLAGLVDGLGRGTAAQPADHVVGRLVGEAAGGVRTVGAWS